MGTCSLYFLFGPCLWSEWFCRALLCDVITDLKQQDQSVSCWSLQNWEPNKPSYKSTISGLLFLFKMFIYSSFIPYIPTMASLPSIPLKAMENWIAKTISIVCKVSRGILVIDFKFNSTVLRGHNWYNPSLLIVFFFLRWFHHLSMIDSVLGFTGSALSSPLSTAGVANVLSFLVK